VLKEWAAWATQQEQEALAKAAGTTVPHLFKQIANGHRQISAKLAGRVEEAAAQIRQDDGRLPEISRTDLCDTCAQCPYARKCKEGVKIPLT
jgi:hypothetical protein